MNNEKVIYLSLSTFAGIVPIASHYYCKLKTSSGKSVEIKRQINSPDEAEELNYLDDGDYYKIGYFTNRFPNERAARQAGIKEWRKHFPKGVVLIEGDPTYAEPQPILRGRLKTLRDIWYRWQKLNMFDNAWRLHRKEAERLCKLWDVFIRDLREMKLFIVRPRGNGFSVEKIGRQSLGLYADNVQAQEIEDTLNEGVAKFHYQKLMERITDALDKVRLKRYTGEPARSDAEEIEVLVEQVLKCWDEHE